MDVAAFLLALVPIIWLVVMLLCFKWPAWKAAIGSFVLSCVLALAWWHLPAAQIATASLEGFLMALWPIVLVIIAADHLHQQRPSSAGAARGVVLRRLYGGHGRLWYRRCHSRRHARGPWF